MTSPTNSGPEPQQIEGRSVRDIAEYSPEQVDDAWCRRIFRQILRSLELQYAMHMPRRAITPDTIVFHENGEPLLTPLDIGPPDDREAEDLNALARVVHYAITQELVPMGPLAGRVDGYSDALLDAVDRCMDPDPARRPQTIAALRELLGIVPPGAPVRGASPDVPPDLSADEPALPEIGTSSPPHDHARNHAHDGQDNVPAAQHAPSHDAPRVPQPAAARNAAHAAPHVPAKHDTHDTHGTAVPGDGHEARPAPGNAGAHAVPQVPGHDRASAAAHGAGPAAAPAVTPTARTIPPPAPGTRAAPRRRAGLSSRQRWALAAGIAVFVGLALATFAELRDSGPFEHIDLAAPQPAGATHTAPDAAASAPAQPGIDGATGSAPAAGAPAPATSTGAGVAAGLAPGETVVPGSTVPVPGTRTQPPGVVVTPNGNVYKLQIQPWGTVYVDGVDRGVSPPVKRLTLAPGRHTLRITNPNFQERVIEVDTATGDGQISVDFTADPPHQ